MATILVVDDQPINREFFTTLLGYEHHQLLEASDGAEALARARAQPPDLVVTDILMPTMDGYELVRQLRADPVTAHIPIILYTAIYEQREARTLAQACGRCYFLPKPTDPQQVLHLVRAALAPAPASAAGEALATPSPEQYHSEHLRLLTDTLVRKVSELQQTVARLEQVNRELVLQKYALQAADARGRAREQLLRQLADELPASTDSMLASLTRMEADSVVPPAMHGEIAILRRAAQRQAQLVEELFAPLRAAGKAGAGPGQTSIPPEA